MSGASKKAFGFLELILVLALLGLMAWMIMPHLNPSNSQLDVASKRLMLYLQQTRYQAMLNNPYSPSDALWHKKRWTLKFLNCTNESDGLYYAIYSDTNKTGQIAKDETLKDPLTQKYIYNNNQCETKKDRSAFTLLTKEFGITDVKISCNDTSTIGQLSFGYDGKLYSKLSSFGYDSDAYMVQNPCDITLSNDIESRTIRLEPITGYIHFK